MRKILLILLIIILLTGIVYIKSKNNNISSPLSTQQLDQKTTNNPLTTQVIAENLDTPWGMVFLPDESMLITERPGRVRFINNKENLEKIPVATINGVKEIGEGGLLGITLHPDFSSNNYVYLYYTYAESGGSTMNKVVRMTYKDGRLDDEHTVIDKIPGASNHNGGRIKFGPDKYLYITTGDAQEPSQAQDTDKLGGKILRVTDTGDPAPGNPFNNLVYTYGHRNPQGLAWGKDNRLWETEHGSTAYDEVNVIYMGQNYGWPEIRGDEGKEGMEKPSLHSETTTWAPSGAVIKDDVLYFTGLRGEALFAFDIKPDPRLIVGKKRMFKDYFKNQFGRLREIVLGPDGMFYITTSNRDGRGNPDSSDDKIIKIDPDIFNP